MFLSFYENFLDFLKFALENNDSAQYFPYSLVENYSKLLYDLNRKLKSKGFQYPRLEYDKLLKIIFKLDLDKFLPLINNIQKKELILNFEIIIHLYHFLLDRNGELGVNEIKIEIKKVRRELILLKKYFNQI